MNAALATLCALSVVIAPRAVSAQALTGTTASGIYYEVSGTGEPLILVHAFSVDRRMWQPQIAAFEVRFRVIRVDLRGHGRSAPPLAPYYGYEDLRDVMDTLRVRRATLIGLSAGSDVALNFALVYPERVDRLVLASPGLGGHPVGPLPWAVPPSQAAARGAPQEAAALWADTPIMALTQNQAARDEFRSLVLENWKLWTYRRLELPLTPPASQRLQDLTIPTLIITGAQDLSHIHEIADAISTGSPHSRQLVIPHAGHFVNIDDAQRFNEALSDFLARRSGQTR